MSARGNSEPIDSHSKKLYLVEILQDIGVHYH